MKKCDFLYFFPVFLCLLAACSGSDKTKLEIAPVSNINYEAGNGSILFRWNLPEVPVVYTDISYVDANANVRKILVNGKLNQCVINGFSDSKTYEFRFVTYNARGETSEPIVMFAAAKEPLVNIFNGKVKLTTDLGGMNIQWDNEYNTEFYVEIRYTDINGNDFSAEILVPANHSGTQFVPIASKVTGTQSIDVYVTTTDVYGNTSPATLVKFFKVEAGKLDRSRWTVANFSSEAETGEGTTGRARDVLDGLADTYWHARWQGSPTQTFPNHYLTFDLGSRKRLEETDLQHRQTKIMAGSIEFLGNNQSPTAADADWKNFASITMDQSNKGLQRFIFPNPVEFRYVRLRFTTPGSGDATYAGLAEFSLYGADVVE
ncbi:MAG: discoidin domain-containing protein [Culturomica sp.]|jgi:hypothetical protein|nr:discoidin domain-containing protein [Culturomica sp.]